VRAAHDGSFEVDVQVPASGAYLVISDTWFPGCRASVNDIEVPVIRAYGSMRAVALPPGTTHVRMWYDPASLDLGCALSAVGLLVALMLWKRRKENGEVEDRET
jgi:uncharacterized membrane protein YfhO